MKPRKEPIDTRYKNPDNDPRGPYVLSDVTSPFERLSLRYEWHGHLPPEGRSWRYTEERARTLEAEGRISFSSPGQPRLKRYLSEVSRPAPGEPSAEADSLSQLEFIVRTAMKAIASAIARNPRCLRDVEWRDLERVLREVFEHLGFATELTRSGKDGGFDLRLECQEENETRTFLVEVKHWLASGKKPGSLVLSALVDVVAIAANGATGVLLSSSGFTKDILNGRTEVEQHNVRIGGRAKIVSLCQSYLQSMEGLWSPTTELSEMLLEGTE